MTICNLLIVSKLLFYAVSPVAQHNTFSSAHL